MAHILIIDDDEQVRKMLQQMVERAGYETSVAADGNEGIHEYRKNPCDLIITDLIMPDKEGIETIMDLKKEYPDVKIFAISGGGRNTPENYLDVARKLGALKTFTKPVRRQDLLEAIEQVLAI